MEPRVAVVGIGHAGFAPITAGVSYKELMFEAAQRAYFDAGVDPRTDVDSFVCCSEDFLEGTSIFDEYVPDQLGAVQRPVQTVAGDGLFGFVQRRVTPTGLEVPKELHTIVPPAESDLPADRAVA